jgi:hypothetical protein
MRYLLILLLLLTACAHYPALPERSQTHPVYSPGQVVVPEFYIERSPDGSYQVYRSDQILVPEYTVRPTPQGYEVYPRGEYIFPEFRIEKEN